jgi:hypothetical protein
MIKYILWVQTQDDKKMWCGTYTSKEEAEYQLKELSQREFWDEDDELEVGNYGISEVNVPDINI